VEIDSRTQSVSRVANDRIYNVLWGVEAEDGAFLCECNRLSCTEAVVMTGSEYLSLRDRGEAIDAHNLAARELGDVSDRLQVAATALRESI
jgi:hypothetical protein